MTAGVTKMDRVVATPAALAFIAELQSEYGAIMFHQSGGCCDGSSPMCYPQGDFHLGDGDTLLGEIGGAPVYIGKAQGEAWAHTQLILDVVAGRGGMFSLDNGREKRFLTRSRLMNSASPNSASPNSDRPTETGQNPAPKI